MPGTRCTVAVCNNSFEKTKRAGIKIKYHKFPKAQPVRNIWIESCKRAGEWNPDSCHICSIHFTDDDYKQDTTENPSVIGKKRLRPTAIPSLFLTEPPPMNVPSLRKHKERKPSLNDKTPTYYNEDNIMYSQDSSSHADTTNNCFEDYEFCKADDLDNDQSFYFSMSENGDSTNFEEQIDLQNSQNYFVNRHKIIKKLKNHDEPCYTSKNYCTILRNSATETKPDYFLENYQSLVDENEKLKSKLVKLSMKYEKLLLNAKFLESKLRNFNLIEHTQEL